MSQTASPTTSPTTNGTPPSALASHAVPAEPPFDVGTTWRSVRKPIAAVIAALILLTVLAGLGRAGHQGPLDPRNDEPDGGHALAALLRQRGVSVSITTQVPQLAAGSNTTVLVTQPSRATLSSLRALASSPATIVLIDPDNSELAASGFAATLDAETTTVTLSPQCTLPAAVTAAAVRIAGDLYAPSSGGNVAQPGRLDGACYPQGGDAALITTTRDNGGHTIAFGSPVTFSNQGLAKAGDAALALSLLDSAHVVWAPATLQSGAAPRSQRGLFNLLPRRLLWAVLQLIIAVVVLALWRARRLGRPVPEPLPVVVRAAETVEGRARLLHAARSRDAAADSLRAAAIRRIGQTLRLGVDADASSVAALVAERTGRPAVEIAAVLYGDEPANDAALATLAQDLVRLEDAVRRNDGSANHPSTAKAGTS